MTDTELGFTMNPAPANDPIPASRGRFASQANGQEATQGGEPQLDGALRARGLENPSSLLGDGSPLAMDHGRMAARLPDSDGSGSGRPYCEGDTRVAAEIRMAALKRLENARVALSVARRQLHGLSAEAPVLDSARDRLVRMALRDTYSPLQDLAYDAALAPEQFEFVGGLRMVYRAAKVSIVPYLESRPGAVAPDPAALASLMALLTRCVQSCTPPDDLTASQGSST